MGKGSTFSPWYSGHTDMITPDVTSDIHSMQSDHLQLLLRRRSLCYIGRGPGDSSSLPNQLAHMSLLICLEHVCSITCNRLASVAWLDASSVDICKSPPMHVQMTFSSNLTIRMETGQTGWNHNSHSTKVATSNHHLWFAMNSINIVFTSHRS